MKVLNPPKWLSVFIDLIDNVMSDIYTEAEDNVPATLKPSYASHIWWAKTSVAGELAFRMASLPLTRKGKAELDKVASSSSESSLPRL